jgi:hypothetical protein
LRRSFDAGRQTQRDQSPLQALALLNNGIHAHDAEALRRARRARTGGDFAQVRRVSPRGWGAPPTARKKSALTEYARQHGLANACRLLFNLNEFTFVD